MTEVINETDYEINEAEFSALADYCLLYTSPSPRD